MKTILRLQYFLQFVSAFWLLLATVHGVPPDVADLGRVLWYPSSELIVEDVTQKEREIYSTPTNREKRNGLSPPIDPGKLISVYRITGKVPSSFYPILISVAKEGTFLSKKTQDIIEGLAASLDGPVVKGGRGPFGTFSLGDMGKGGLILGKIRVPSRVKEMTEPQEKTAIISELRLPGQRIDVRIAFMSALDEGSILTERKGGERYFESFASREEATENPRYDLPQLFEALNKVAISAADADDQRPKTMSAPQKSKDDGAPTLKPGELTTTLPPSANGTNRVWLWVTGLIVTLLVLWSLLKHRT